MTAFRSPFTTSPVEVIDLSDVINRGFRELVLSDKMPTDFRAVCVVMTRPEAESGVSGKLPFTIGFDHERRELMFATPAAIVAPPASVTLVRFENDDEMFPNVIRQIEAELASKTGKRH